MPTPKKSELNTVMAIRKDRLTFIMKTLGVKQAMQSALLLRNSERMDTWRAASKFGVTERGMNHTENRIVKIDRELDELYSK